MQITHNRGRIVEENHYYAYGLRIAGISSRKLPDASDVNIKNNHLYNDKELFDEADLNWYDYGFRNYDPQIGRFVQLDPLTDAFPYYSPYQYAGCEPIANIDLDGLEPVPANVAATPGAMIGGVTVMSIIPKAASQGLKVGAGLAPGAMRMASQYMSGVVNESPCQNCGTPKQEPKWVQPIFQPRNNNFSFGRAKELNQLEKQEQKARNEHLNVLNGYNADGSKHWTQRLQDNKTFQRFEKMTGTMTEIGGLMSGVGAVRTYGPKLFIRSATRGRNIVGTFYDEVLPTQDWINPSKVLEYKFLLKDGQKLSPINAYNQGGKIFIEDGHHRFAAYMEMGMKPNMIIRNTGGPAGYSNWTNTTFQTPTF